MKGSPACWGALGRAPGRPAHDRTINTNLCLWFCRVLWGVSCGVRFGRFCELAIGNDHSHNQKLMTRATGGHPGNLPETCPGLWFWRVVSGSNSGRGGFCALVIAIGHFHSQTLSSIRRVKFHEKLMKIDWLSHARCPCAGPLSDENLFPDRFTNRICSPTVLRTESVPRAFCAQNLFPDSFTSRICSPTVLQTESVPRQFLGQNLPPDSFTNRICFPTVLRTESVSQQFLGQNLFPERFVHRICSPTVLFPDSFGNRIGSG